METPHGERETLKGFAPRPAVYTDVGYYDVPVALCRCGEKEKRCFSWLAGHWPLGRRKCLTFPKSQIGHSVLWCVEACGGVWRWCSGVWRRGESAQCVRCSWNIYVHIVVMYVFFLQQHTSQCIIQVGIKYWWERLHENGYMGTKTKETQSWQIWQDGCKWEVSRSVGICKEESAVYSLHLHRSRHRDSHGDEYIPLFLHSVIFSVMRFTGWNLKFWGKVRVDYQVSWS